MRTIISAFLLLLIAFPVIAQPSRPADAYLLQDDRLVAIDSAGQPLNTFELTPLTSVQSARTDDIDRRTFWSVADIDPTRHYLYRIEAWGRSTNRRMPGAPTGAELVRIDLETNAREVMLDNTSVFNFVLSPDGERMVVFFYGGEYLNARPQACVLTINAKECFRVALEYVSRSGFWVDNQKFVIGTNSVSTLILLDFENSTQISINTPTDWYVSWATLVPNTNSIVITGQPRENATEHPMSFIRYELETGHIQQFAYSAPNTTEYITIDTLSVSPSSQYLLYSGANTSVVNFQTGELIREFTDVFQFGWIDDHTLLLQSRPERGEPEVIRLDARSGSVETVLTGAAAEGMLLFP